MINEWVEFCAYTGTVSYTASKKSDTTWLGRFTFATILEFEGMSRILTVLARGYLFHGKDGAVISGDPHDRVDHARRALCAWCSVPEDGKRVQDKEWQFQTDFSELHPEFPELVDADGVGWFLRHVLRAADFMLTHPEKVRSTSLKYAEVIQSKFAAAWRSKVMQYQIPIFASQTKGAWTLRFDDVLADALELGPLRREGPELPLELTEKVKEAIARLKAAGENLPTVFETETAIAFLYFRKMNCDFVVLETGLGGELDATNIVKNTVCAVFATISRDHLGVIGNTLEEIAQTKAGIIKNGCAVVSAQQKETVSEILKKRAEASDCSYREADLSRFLVEKEDYHGIRFSYKEYKNLRGSLAGECQIANLATALEVIRTLNALGISVPETAVRKGLEETRWPGRFTFLMEHPVFLVDGAHNEDAAQKLRMSMERYFPGRRLILILGVFKDKEYEKIASILCPLAQQVYTVDLPNVERTLPAEKLAECAKKYCRQTAAAGRIEDAVEKAMKAAERAGQRTADSEASAADGEPVILACGSLSYLGDVIRLVEKSYGTRTRGTGKEEK